MHWYNTDNINRPVSLHATHDTHLTHGQRKLRLAEEFEMLRLTPDFQILRLRCDFKTLRLSPARRQPDAHQTPARCNIWFHTSDAIFRNQASGATFQICPPDARFQNQASDIIFCRRAVRVRLCRAIRPYVRLCRGTFIIPWDQFT